MIRYAVVAVERRNGKAWTVHVHDDSRDAQRHASILNRSVPDYRHTTIPYDTDRPKR